MPFGLSRRLSFDRGRCVDRRPYSAPVGAATPTVGITLLITAVDDQEILCSVVTKVIGPTRVRRNSLRPIRPHRFVAAVLGQRRNRKSAEQNSNRKKPGQFAEHL